MSGDNKLHVSEASKEAAKAAEAGKRETNGKEYWHIKRKKRNNLATRGGRATQSQHNIRRQNFTKVKIEASATATTIPITPTKGIICIRSSQHNDNKRFSNSTSEFSPPMTIHSSSGNSRRLQ